MNAGLLIKQLKNDCSRDFLPNLYKNTGIMEPERQAARALWNYIVAVVVQDIS